jgi:4'-phosphopantetheinyl transferase
MQRTDAGPATDPADRRVELWLASPEARSRFDPDLLAPADRSRWLSYRQREASVDFEVSRALVTNVPRPAAAATSLTHSSGHAAFAVAPAGWKIGVDLEFIRARETCALGEFAFSPVEAAALARLSQAERLHRFHLLWVFKEAFIKALGLELAEGLAACRLVRADAAWHAELPTSDPWQAVIYAPRSDCLLALAVIPSAAESWSGTPALHEWPGAGAAQWRRVLRLASAIGDAGSGKRATESQSATTPRVRK